MESGEEIPGYRIEAARRIGITQLGTIKRVKSSIQKYVNEVDSGEMDTGGKKEDIAAEELIRASLYDMILGNTDRHDSNWLQSTDGSRLLLIDHGLILSTRKGEWRSELFDEAAERDLPLPADIITKFKTNWLAISRALRTLKIEPIAIRLAKQRKDIAIEVAEAGGNFNDLSEKFYAWRRDKR